MTDGTGAVRARYNYTPYGERTKMSGDLDATFGFTGKISDKPRDEHPFERAVRWSALLEKDEGCLARDLAHREKTSEATVSMTLALMRLTPAIRQTMHLLVATGRAYHFGLRVLAKIAAMPSQKQGAAFAALLHRWRIQLENPPSEKL